MPKIDLDALPQTNASTYPPQHVGPVAGRYYRRLASVAGLTDFGASHVTLAPGGWSSQRHWHEAEDELVVIVTGEAVLIDEAGRTPLRPGDVAAFPRGDGNGHHLVNESDAPCVFVAIGRPPASDCHYPDVDMVYRAEEGAYRRRDGSSF